MARPCLPCSNKEFNCTYDRVRKKRGAAGKRISEIRHLQNRSIDCDNNAQETQSLDGSPDSNEAPAPRSSEYTGSLELEPTITASSNGTVPQSPDQLTTQSSYWSLGTSPRPTSSDFSSLYDDMGLAPQAAPTSATTLTRTSRPRAATDMSALSHTQSSSLFPSLPIDSPPDGSNAFGAILQQDLPPLVAAADAWPQSIGEESLLPWIDVYFKGLHPTIPILHRPNLYRDMLLRKHHTDPQYGAMLLGLCAFAMTQPV